MSAPGYQHPAWDQIEGAATVNAKTPTTVQPGEHEIELSKAISLKRIADVLEGATATDGSFFAYVRHD